MYIYIYIYIYIYVYIYTYIYIHIAPSIQLSGASEDCLLTNIVVYKFDVSLSCTMTL